LSDELSMPDVVVGAFSPSSADSQCGVDIAVQAAGLQGQVSFERGSEGRFVPLGFHLGPDFGGSLSVHGRHVIFVVAGECTDCATYSTAVRYGSALTTPPEQDTNIFEFDLSVDPSVWGAYCSTARRADGSVTVAGCSLVHPGDFAAS
jgi:hypothetical protein